MKRLTLASALALMLSVASGGLLATLSSETAAAQDPPVDCKKTPEHPKCADKK